MDGPVQREQRDGTGREVSGRLRLFVRLLGYFNIKPIACQVDLFPFPETLF